MPFADVGEVRLFFTDEGAGHWLHQERPAEFNAIVTAWLPSIG